MLPAGSRIRRREDFRRTIRAGRRIAGPALVVHVHAPAAAGPDPRAGFVVSRAVGGAVARNAVRRRLRHLMVTRLAALPAACDVVVRALPPAASADSASLGAELDRAFERWYR